MCQMALKFVSQVPFTFCVGDEIVASPYLTVMIWFDVAAVVFSPGMSTQAMTSPGGGRVVTRSRS